MGRDCYGPSLLWAEMSRNPEVGCIGSGFLGPILHRRLERGHFNITFVTLTMHNTV